MTDEHAILIGASRGLGRAVARLFAATLTRVSAIGRHPPAPGALPPSVRVWPVDITDPVATAAALREIVHVQGLPRRLVFFQRHRGAGPDWDAEIEVSLGATRRILEDLVETHGLHDCGVVLVSSVNASLISPRLPVGYHVAKAGLVQLARYYAVVLGSRGIRVNSISPGTFLKDETRDAFMADPTRVRQHQDATALGRIGTADEVAQVVDFLSGPLSSFITGQDVVVDGGASLRYQETLVAALPPSTP